MRVEKIKKDENYYKTLYQRMLEKSGAANPAELSRSLVHTAPSEQSTGKWKKGKAITYEQIIENFDPLDVLYILTGDSDKYDLYKNAPFMHQRISELEDRLRECQKSATEYRIRYEELRRNYRDELKSRDDRIAETIKKECGIAVAALSRGSLRPGQPPDTDAISKPTIRQGENNHQAAAQSNH